MTLHKCSPLLPLLVNHSDDSQQTTSTLKLCSFRSCLFIGPSPFTCSQFEDIFSADHFKEYLRPDVQIVDRLPGELSELDLANIGSVVSASFLFPLLLLFVFSPRRSA